MKRWLPIGVCLLVAGAAWANFVTGFEAPDYIAGQPLNGQQGWYLPPQGGVSYNVYTYAGNEYGFVQNPYGGDQFVARIGEGDPNYGRSQHDFPFGAETYMVSYDIAVKFAGALPAADYLGSFSLQPSTTSRYFQTLFKWKDLNNPGVWQLYYVINTQSPPGTLVWDNLQPDHWYRNATWFSLATNQIVQISLTDLHTGWTETIQPTGWSMNYPTYPLPTGIRFFTGGTTAGNICGWDNLTLVPEPAAVAVLLLGIAALGARRTRQVTAAV